MALSLVTAPAENPITVEEAKAQCRVDDADEYGIFASLIKAATDYAESFTHRALITQTWDLKGDGFPADGTIWIPKPPLQTTPVAPVITYVDTNGTTQTLGSTLYTIDAPSGPMAGMGSIVPAYGLTWPSTRDVPNAMTVRFYCGYGLAASVPESIKVAIRLLVAHWWENRSIVNIGNIVTTIPMGIDALLYPYKAF